MNSAAYTASKWGMLGFAHALFDELKEYGLKVSTICPGYVDTQQHHRDKMLNLNPSNMIQPQDVAKAVRCIMEFPVTACPTEIQIRPQKNV